MPATPAEVPADVTGDDSAAVADTAAVEPAVDPALRQQLDEAHTRIDNLVAALETNRVIGIAVGIAAERYRFDPQQAFNLLVGISQRSNRKLRDVAGEIVETGVIPGVPPADG